MSLRKENKALIRKLNIYIAYHYISDITFLTCLDRLGHIFTVFLKCNGFLILMPWPQVDSLTPD